MASMTTVNYTDYKCPNGDDLRGAELPENLQSGERTHYSNVIGIDLQGVYDGVLYWQCPTCGVSWPRFTDSTRLGYLSQFYSEEQNKWPAEERAKNALPPS